MFIWIVMGAAMLVAGVIILKKYLATAMQATWLTVYRRHVAAGQTSEQAIGEVLGWLRGRAPFNALSEAEARSAASYLALLHDPELFTMFLCHVESTRDVSLLRNPQELGFRVGHMNAQAGHDTFGPAARQDARAR
jgi:hypothetical protein